RRARVHGAGALAAALEEIEVVPAAEQASVTSKHCWRPNFVFTPVALWWKKRRRNHRTSQLRSALHRVTRSHTEREKQTKMTLSTLPLFARKNVQSHS